MRQPWNRIDDPMEAILGAVTESKYEVAFVTPLSCDWGRFARGSTFDTYPQGNQRKRSVPRNSERYFGRLNDELDGKLFLLLVQKLLRKSAACIDASTVYRTGAVQ